LGYVAPSIAASFMPTECGWRELSPGQSFDLPNGQKHLFLRSRRFCNDEKNKKQTSTGVFSSLNGKTTGELEKALSSNESQILRELAEGIRAIRYGSIVLVVHDGRLVEVAISAENVARCSMRENSMKVRGKVDMAGRVGFDALNAEPCTALHRLVGAMETKHLLWFRLPVNLVDMY
jgi:hypothetical protein